MPSSFTPSLRLTLPVTGENPGTWGDLVNNGITSLVDSSVAGYAAVTMTDANYTLTTANGAADEARRMMLNISGTLSGARNVICPTASKLYFIKNATTGGFAITLKTSAGSGVSIPNGQSAVLMCDGVNVREAVDYSTNVNTTNIAYTGTLTGGTGVVNLGSGQVYKSTSGNVGLGVVPSAWTNIYKTLQLGTGAGVSGRTDIYAYAAISSNAYCVAHSTWKYMFSGAAACYEQDTGAHYWFSAPSGTAGTTVAFTPPKMTLDASGNLLVGTTNITGAQGLIYSPNAQQITLGHTNSTATGTNYINFLYNTLGIGSITQSGTTAVLYNTTSDQRLKTNIVDAPAAGTLVDSIQVRSFDWKSDGSHQRYGMVAQELLEVAPEAVHQPVDPADMMAVDYSKLVPVLVKEVQSLRARVAALEAK